MTTGVRESEATGDLRYKSEEVRDPSQRWWFGIWEEGNVETGVMVRSEGKYPLDLEDCR